MSNRRRHICAAKSRGNHTREDWIAMSLLCGGKCVRCGSPSVGKDHILSISLGGSNGIENIQPLCWPCNKAKRLDVIDYRKSNWSDAFPVTREAVLTAEHLVFASSFAPAGNDLEAFAEKILDAIKDSVARGCVVDRDIRAHMQRGRDAARRAANSMRKFADSVGDI